MSKTEKKIRTYVTYKRTSIDEPLIISDIVPPVLADRIRLMLNTNEKYHHRENARTTLLQIRDELTKALNQAERMF